MNDLFTMADRNQQRAREIIQDICLLEIWAAHGVQANLVGSLRNGLLLHNKDIDMHVYSDPFVLADSFAAMAQLAENRRIKRIEYANLLDTEEECLEWHAWYQDDEEVWKLDMIHIRKGSRYDGYFEKVADRIREVLTPETKKAILSIKNDLPADCASMGIEIYKAVIADNVRTCQDFLLWKAQNPGEGVLDWMP